MNRKRKPPIPVEAFGEPWKQIVSWGAGSALQKLREAAVLTAAPALAGCGR